MAAIDTIYNYYLNTYGHQTVARSDTHKKSELRTVYNNMVKVNKESPLYKIPEVESGDLTKFVIDVKESARMLQKVTAALGDDINFLKKKIAYSSDSDNVDVHYIGEDGDEANLSTSFEIQVQQLAASQLNIGNYLVGSEHSVPAGKHTFDFDTSRTSYEFQFNVGDTESNRSVQDKLASLINSAGVGVVASVSEDENGLSSLRLESKDTGLASDEDYRFRIMPGVAKDSQYAMEVLGFNQVSREARSSAFLLNGASRSSLANNFTINNAFEIHLKGLSNEDQPATIGFKNDAETISENIGSLVDAYNQIIRTSAKYAGTNQEDAKLANEVASVGKAFQEDLSSMGLYLQPDGLIEIDQSQLLDSISQDESQGGLETMNQFKNALGVRGSKIALNPMSYVHKIVVAYKNPGKSFNTPYASSMYSGIMLDTRV